MKKLDISENKNVLTAAVVMAIYNPNPEYLYEQLKSIYLQSNIINELLVIDDNSTNTNIIHELIDLLKQELNTSPISIRLIKHTENIGHTRSFVSYLNTLSSDIIFFSDQDDIWDINKIHICLSHFKNNPKILCLTHDFYEFKGEINNKSESMMTTLIKKGIYPVKVGHGFSTAIRSSVAPLVSLATDDRGGHDGWILTFGDLLGVRMIAYEPLAHWRRHDLAHGIVNSDTKNVSLNSRMIAKISFRHRIKNYERELLNYIDIKNWLDKNYNRLDDDLEKELKIKLLKFGIKLSIRSKILSSSPLYLAFLIFKVNSKTLLGDYISKILNPLLGRIY